VLLLRLLLLRLLLLPAGRPLVRRGERLL